MIMKLKRDFENIISKYGHDILLLRSDRKTTCTCYNSLTGSIRSDCPYCFGMGTVPVIEKHKVREQDMRVPETLPYLPDSQLFGEMAVATRAYFMRMDAEPHVHDVILDVDWDGNTPIYSGRGLYEISHIDAKRFENGAFVFQKIYVKDDPIGKNIRAIKIVEQAGKTFYQLEADKL